MMDIEESIDYTIENDLGVNTIPWKEDQDR